MKVKTANVLRFQRALCTVSMDLKDSRKVNAARENSPQVCWHLMVIILIQLHHK